MASKRWKGVVQQSKLRCEGRQLQPQHSFSAYRSTTRVAQNRTCKSSLLYIRAFTQTSTTMHLPARPNSA